MKRLLIVMLAGILAACGPTMPAFTGVKGLNANPYILDITWDATDRCKVDSVTEDTTTCVLPGTAFCVGRGDFIIWRSNNPSDAKYEIFFDPILGRPLKARRKGIVVRMIDAKAPIADYKYSIVRDGCSPNLENVYDPHIRVDH